MFTSVTAFLRENTFTKCGAFHQNSSAARISLVKSWRKVFLLLPWWKFFRFFSKKNTLSTRTYTNLCLTTPTLPFPPKPYEFGTVHINVIGGFYMSTYRFAVNVRCWRDLDFSWNNGLIVKYPEAEESVLRKKGEETIVLYDICGFTRGD